MQVDSWDARVTVVEGGSARIVLQRLDKAILIMRLFNSTDDIATMRV